MCVYRCGDVEVGVGGDSGERRSRGGGVEGNRGEGVRLHIKIAHCGKI